MLNKILVLKSLIKKIDWYGPSIHLRIKKEEKYKTTIGGIFSLVSFSLFFYFFGIFGTDYFLKINPTIMLKSEYNNYQNFTLQAENFFFAWKIYDDEDDYFNITDYFDLNINIYSYSGGFYQKLIKLNQTSCENSIKNESSPFYSDLLKVDSLNCLSVPYEKNDNFSIGGFWNSGFLRYIFFDFTPKYFNKSQKEEIYKSKFYRKFKNNKIIFEYIIPESYFEVSNYSYPLKHNLIPHYSILSNKMYRVEDIFYGNSIVLADYGSIFEDIKKFENVGYLRSEILAGSYEENSFEYDFIENHMDYYSISIYFDRNEKILSRKYMKIQELFGNIIGFMEILTVLMEFTFSLFVKFDLNKYLSDNFVHIIKNDEKLIQVQNSKSLKMIKNSNEIQSYFNNNFNRNLSIVNIWDIKKDFSLIENKLKNINFEDNKKNKSFLSFNDLDNVNKKDLNFPINKIKENEDDMIFPKKNTEFGINSMEKNKKACNPIKRLESYISLRTVDDPLFKKKLDIKYVEKVRLESIFHMEKNQNIFDLNIFSFYLRSKCFHSRKNQYDKNLSNVHFLRKINKSLQEKLDIFNYFKISNELILIKDLLFNEKQKSVINFLSEKCFYLNYFVKDKVLKFNKLFQENHSNILQVLHNIEFMNQDESSFNGRLFDIIEELL